MPALKTMTGVGRLHPGATASGAAETLPEMRIRLRSAILSAQDDNDNNRDEQQQQQENVHENEDEEVEMEAAETFACRGCGKEFAAAQRMHGHSAHCQQFQSKFPPDKFPRK